MSTTIARLSTPIVCLALLCLAACGGGGDGGDETVVDVVAASIEPTGPVDNSTTGNWDNTLLGLGEFGPAAQFMNNWRGIITFDIAGIPQNATIVSAELVANQWQVNGQPFFNLGRIIIDHIEMGPTMLGEAYSQFTVGGNAGLDVATFSATSTLGQRTVDITGLVARDVSVGSGRTQLRLRFVVPNNDDGTLDNVFIYGPGNPDAAFLKIRYTTP